MTNPAGYALYTLEFHISRQARDRYQFDQTLFATNGNVIFANFHAARQFSQRMNAQRDLVAFPEQVVRAGDINAMGLIDEIMHLVLGMYREQRNPVVMQQALAFLYEKLGSVRVEQALRLFAEEFPPAQVYRREASLDGYLESEGPLILGPAGGTIQVPNRQIVLEEMVMLWLANANSAFSPFLELFDDSRLEKNTAYSHIIRTLHDFFETQPRFGPDNQNLIDMLRAPALADPHSLSGQLEFIRTRWGTTLLGKYLYRLLSSLDLIKEEEKAFFGTGGPGPARVLEFADLEQELERFSPDRDWMPSLVLIAKNAYVWLDQLSKYYRRGIYTLDQVPDEELDRLSRAGFSGLWLIGLWERSQASKRIKQLRGNPDAVASAYSLFDYQIAGDLGGDDAYQSLHDRAWRRGIRLASDMVPNHMGIDSRWVTEHPDWFISLEYSPFPSYTFDGPNLSWDERVGIYLEDHYFDNTDAAVVFKQVDFWSGQTRYIYHGNDGTSMPWNDTAQLNYLMPEVREAVIQTILSVARKFPVIRFDAAMTLAKKHYQRLWFPEPGTGGAIPSRSDHGLTKEQFDALIPEEFWREVVDRVAQEAPDTLLLAEAFWLMEGYFVRTLGMHRVYNSAFMNMLRDEKNAEYRLVIKNTLEFDPEILKRYVNFMNNPDERTAVDQFGRGDKYFGACVLMSTLPGLPMFGHGQIEGFTEKYGMEYRRAYWDEIPDQYLVERHEREVFPLLRQRYLFADVRDFLLYDFFGREGGVNENIFAYSNRAGQARSLVVYHNKFASAQGWIRTSAAFSVKTESGDRQLVQRSLGEGLELDSEQGIYCIFRDMINGLEYIRSSQEIHSEGLYIELEAYQYHVFVDFRQVQDNEWGQYANLSSYLAGRGVPNIEEAMKEIFLQPVHQPFRELVNKGYFQWVIDNRAEIEQEESEGKLTLKRVTDEGYEKSLNLLKAVKILAEGEGYEEEAASELKRKLEVIMTLPTLEKRYPLSRSRKYQAALKYLQSRDSEEMRAWGGRLAWLFTHNLARTTGEEDQEEISRSWLDEWLLGKLTAHTLTEIGLSDPHAWRMVAMLKLMIGHQDWCSRSVKSKDRAFQILQSWLRDGEVQQYLNVNRYQGVLWYNKEAIEDLLWWMFNIAVIQIAASYEAGPDQQELDKIQADKHPVAEQIVACYEVIRSIQEAESAAQYRLEKLLDGVKGQDRISKAQK
jgi:glycosidase